ncbi:STE20-related kinase adapter protein beta isoform X1 [Erpetoichthys calabaricus]|uniref:STE20 related adaptor beta n=1 Tax=Erpetoichthys calabaricus TaxID=27687 RepID=A0A8C4X7A2_ERPCA|nr:STE20-related kinase adapter protein beta isoform X1 [Erpetoichthys calabaricus]XP_028662003.1 STE20-related kinase adapter protein beta isoform X1 [Erpetoichthys calabaricus]XP_028662004.1 STE20-related kinase adapter protein beta isoform X1 [Erpetoichthys calabaricus]XP_028662006.1 STE20-related kinase adapter protein beta isoform X1 [Erpetoichthys calabaricus]XP_051786635.1 STE20-related kinase adapter protein beta isoform X1 [Erpetoichthys calabaricus]
MSFLDCLCVTQTLVETLSSQDPSDGVSHQYLSSEPAPCSTPTKVPAEEKTIYASDASHYQLLSELGRGFNNHSLIATARHHPCSRLVAIRLTNLDRCGDEDVRALQNEVLRTRLFSHPNILRSHVAFLSSSWLWVVTPLMDFGSAECLLRTYFPDGMSESLIAYILYGVLQALVYLHGMGFIHRSIKASHILLSGDGRVCLTGLRSLCSMMQHGKRSRVVFDIPENSASILPWLSPEVLRQDLHGYDVKSDSYSLGITACELASGRVPFQNVHPTLMLLQKLSGTPFSLLDTTPFPLQGLRLKASRSGVDSGIGESVAASSLMRTMTAERPQSPAPKNFSSLFHNLVELCIQQEPEKRPSASSLLTHTFFRQAKMQSKETVLDLLQPAIPLSSLPARPRLPTASAHFISATSQGRASSPWEF